MPWASSIFRLAVAIPRGLGRQLCTCSATQGSKKRFKPRISIPKNSSNTAATNSRQAVKQRAVLRFCQLRLPASCLQFYFSVCLEVPKAGLEVPRWGLIIKSWALEEVCAGAKNSSSNSLLPLDFLSRLISPQFILLTVCHSPITQPLSGCYLL